MPGTCHLKEPSVPFKIVTGVTLEFDDGSSEASTTNDAIGMVEVDGQLITKEAFNAKYDVDGQTGPLA